MTAAADPPASRAVRWLTVRLVGSLARWLPLLRRSQLRSGSTARRCSPLLAGWRSLAGLRSLRGRSMAGSLGRLARGDTA